MQITEQQLQTEMYRRFGLILEGNELTSFANWINHHAAKPQSDYDARMQQLRDLGLA